MAAIITQGDQILYENYVGYADVEKRVPVDSSTVFHMASLTKMFTGQLMLALKQRGVLEQPVNKYVTGQNFPDSIKVKHVLQHSSQGVVGKNFYYSARFRLLTNVIEKEYGVSFDRVVNDSIIMPYSLDNTFLLNDTSQLIGKPFAKPYVFDGDTKPGFVDYGFSASAGIASTVRDLAKFSKAIDTTPEFDEPYNYGLFSQTIEGIRVLWAYGQYDCYSSLFIKIPDKGLTFVIAGNNSLISDPPRMIYGDVTTSLFALTFFKNFVPEFDLHDRELFAKALAESFFSQVEKSRAETSKTLLREAFETGSEYRDLSTFHNILQLKDIALRVNSVNFTEFDSQARQIGALLLKKDPFNPYANYYMANFYELNGQPDSTALYYQTIIDSRNFDDSWMRREANRWIMQNASTSGTDTLQPR